ncbi:hypothetical protein B9G69_012820 [Bdellovibrio sp. SKB1291214]|uniref:hypothetical protein n=1 Tax=Bdellovibrio sp. SKB1291214 TaxID=1732569 RepID=UPI000B517BD3|nr:hypothetical protein [Bdellovibrio sp. SKB1291214]UYL07929.1 hypothetical protein B9G69_012820 [Bdellovibrio sp. SKB1291214]
MKVLSTVVLLSGLIVSSFAQASQLPNDALNSYQLLRSIFAKYDITKGDGPNDAPCKLTLILQEKQVYLGLEKAPGAALLDGVFTTLDMASAERVVVGSYGWDGEQTDFIIDRAPEALTVKAINIASERAGGGAEVAYCTFYPKK